MDTPKPPKPDHLLDDLESIRQLLEEQQLEPPLLTDSLDDDLQIPLLSDIIEPGPAVAATAPAKTLAAPAPASSTISSAIQRRVSAQNLTELHRLDDELRAAAQLLLQDVIDDFVPQIEAELKRRLDARLDRLIKQPKP